MDWVISWSKESLRFLNKNKIEESDIVDTLRKAKEKIEGKNINVDVKRLEGVWKPFLRIRIGKIRVIAEFNFSKHQIYIHRIDYRGNVYT
ncbi:MAG: hypothetical protein AAB400_03855 [Patescibacteria group bacterium]